MVRPATRRTEERLADGLGQRGVGVEAPGRVGAPGVPAAISRLPAIVSETFGPARCSPRRSDARLTHTGVRGLR
ncbi:hypothetical protein [Streptomyces sp. NPDC048425]|uniref:hypothetical protein n=1 Tax=Streptomyces sp. NPDC048425 TaxID=3365548 RepID=UPI00371FDEC6